MTPERPALDLIDHQLACAGWGQNLPRVCGELWIKWRDLTVADVPSPIGIVHDVLIDTEQRPLVAIEAKHVDAIHVKYRGKYSTCRSRCCGFIVIA